MRTAGIDLSTQPDRTAVCTVDWGTRSALVTLLSDRSDHGLVQVCRGVDKVGIDCPLGWPEPFVAALAAHRDGHPWPGSGQDPDRFRANLALRETDRQVRRLTGRSPLSVAADRIGLTAMRCALLLDSLGDVDRTGVTGVVAEVYPAASLQSWGMRSTGYKGPANRFRLADMLDQLMRMLPVLECSPGTRDQLVHSDDAFDALVCAITAKAVAGGRSSRPETGEQARLAAIEGWIHVPDALP